MDFVKEFATFNRCDKDFICDDFIPYRSFINKDKKLIDFVCAHHIPKIKRLIKLMRVMKQEKIFIKDKSFSDDMSFEQYEITLMRDLSYRIGYVKFINDEGVLSFHMFLKHKT